MLRRALVVWLLTLGSIPALFVVSLTSLGLHYDQEVFVDSRLPTISGCFGRSEVGIENTWSQDLCTFGSPGSQRSLLIVGDSTVASMIDGLVSATADLDMEIVAYPSRGCTFTARFPHSYKWCSDYFEKSIELISKIRPKGLIISNYLSRMDLPDRRIPLINGELPQSRQQRLESTIDSLTEALLTARQLMPETPILIIHEIPTVPFRRPSVLFNQAAFPVVDEKSRSYLRQREYISAVERVATTFSNVSVIDPKSVLCRRSICSAKTSDDMWLYMDSYHLNPRGSSLLSGQFREWILNHVSSSQSGQIGS